jgi:ribosomal protein L37AE/L43A
MNTQRGDVMPHSSALSERPYCPHCHEIPLRRDARQGFWQVQVLTRLGYYPWECGQCRQVFHLRQRAVCYHRSSRSGAQRQPVGAHQGFQDSPNAAA